MAASAPRLAPSRPAALTLAHRQTANGIAFEIDLFQRSDGFGTQLRKDRSLHNAELAIAGTRDKRVAGSFGPAHGKAHRLRCLRFGRRKGCTFIERHGDGRIQKMLDFSGAFRRQAMLAAVKMGFEGHPILIQFASAYGKAAVFIDYCCLFQKPYQSDAERSAFKEGLDVFLNIRTEDTHVL